MLRSGLMAAAGAAIPARALSQLGSVGDNMPPALKSPARALIGKMSASLLGPTAGPLLSGPLMNVLGLSPKSIDFEAYFQAIESKLDVIDSKLDLIGQQLDGLHVDFERLTTDVLSVEAQVTSEAFQQSLREIERSANRVSASFQQYGDALNALANDATRKAAAKQLFDLYSSNNTRNISEALANLQDQFDPRISERKTVLEYLKEMLRTDLRAYASNQENFKLAAYHPSERYGFSFGEIPNDEGIFGYSTLMTGSHDRAQTMLNRNFAAILRFFVKIQLQGMLVLTSAWENSINAPQLARISDRNEKIFQKTRKFTRQAADDVDAAVAGNLKEFGKRLGRPITDDGNTLWSTTTFAGNLDTHWEGHGTPEGGSGRRGYQLSSDYIMWGRAQTRIKDAYQPYMKIVVPGTVIEDLLMVQNPWNYENCRTVGLYFSDTHGKPLTSNTYCQIYFGQMNVARFNPDSLTELAFLEQLA